MKIIVTGHKRADYGIISEKLERLLSKLDKKRTTLVMGKGDPIAHFVELFSFKQGWSREVHMPDVKKNSFAAVSVMHEEMLGSGAKVLVAFCCKQPDEQVESLLARAPKHKVKVRKIRFKG